MWPFKKKTKQDTSKLHSGGNSLGIEFDQEAYDLIDKMEKMNIDRKPTQYCVGDRVKIRMPLAGTSKPEETGLKYEIIMDEGLTGTITAINEDEMVLINWDPGKYRIYKDLNLATMKFLDNGTVQLDGFNGNLHSDYLEKMSSITQEKSLKSETSISPVKEIVEDENKQFRADLWEQLQNPDFEVSSLQGSDVKLAVPILVELLEENQTSALGVLLEISEIGDWSLTRQEYDDLQEALRMAVPTIATYLRDPYRGTRETITKIMCHLARDMGSASQTAIPALIETLQDEEGYIRGNAAIALGNMRPVAKDAVQPLIHLLEESSEGLQQYAKGAVASALGAMGWYARDAIPALIELLETDEDTGTKEHASEALVKIRAGIPDSAI